MSADTPIPKAKNNLPPSPPLLPSPPSVYAGPARRYSIEEWTKQAFNRAKGECGSGSCGCIA